MADLNEEVEIKTTLTDEDGNLLTPLTVGLVVSAPDGTETTPSVNNPSEGVYVAFVTPDQAGRWFWKWEVSTPDGVEWGFIDVGADPPIGLLPLATIADLEARIGPLTDSQRLRAPALLDDASELVRGECRQDFVHIEGDTVTLRSTGQTIVLPKRPITEVTSVVAVGIPPAPDLTLPVGSYVFDGIDKILLIGGTGWIVNLAEAWSTDHANSSAGTYRVTYSHGATIPPKRIKALVSGMVNRTLTAPAISDLVSESVGQGDYAWQAQQGAGAMGASVRLTAGDRAKLKSWGYLRDYGQTETRFQ